MKSIRFVKAGQALGILIVGIGVFIARLILGGQALPAPAGPQTHDSEPFLTHIATDKPIYRIGEKVYVRGVVLRANGHTPGASGPANFQIKGPKGDIVAEGVANIVDSIAGFSWEIPANLAAGEYTVRIAQA